MPVVSQPGSRATLRLSPPRLAARTIPENFRRVKGSKGSEESTREHNCRITNTRTQLLDEQAGVQKCHSHGAATRRPTSDHGVTTAPRWNKDGAQSAKYTTCFLTRRLRPWPPESGQHSRKQIGPSPQRPGTRSSAPPVAGYRGSVPTLVIATAVVLQHPVWEPSPTGKAEGARRCRSRWPLRCKRTARFALPRSARSRLYNTVTVRPSSGRSADARRVQGGPVRPSRRSAR